MKKKPAILTALAAFVFAFAFSLSAAIEASAVNPEGPKCPCWCPLGWGEWFLPECIGTSSCPDCRLP
jgi:hypothetical protein